MKTQTQTYAHTKTDAAKILPFPSILSFRSASDSASRRALRKDLLSALRVSQSPVIVDLSGCTSLNHDDIDLLLQSVAQLAARDTEVIFAAGSRVNRVLLEVTRIASLVPVFNSVKEALACPRSVASQVTTSDAGDAEGQPNSQSQRLRSA